MNIQSVRFEDPAFTRLYRDFITRFDRLKDFYEVNPHKLSDIIKLAEERTFAGDRSKLVEDLIEFNRPFRLSSASMDHIRALAEDSTLTVATGQQMSVYGGPLFTVYKTITVIVLARYLTNKLGRKVVPVFWLADEDHDFAEIATLKLPDQAELQEISLQINSNGQSVSRLNVSPVFQNFREEVKAVLPDTDFSADLWDMLDQSYGDDTGGSLRTGFARLLAAVFSRYGLIFAGSDFKPFKQSLSQHIVTAIEKAPEIHQALESQSASIKRDFHQQAQVRRSTLFWQDEERGRLRLDKRNGGWFTEQGDQWDAHELIERAKSNPDRFSPNVFLRPVLQDLLLPNIAYIGGPAEIAYFGQMKQVYPFFGLKMPLILPRMSATIIEPSVARLITQLPFNLFDYQDRIEDLEQSYIRKCGSNTGDENTDRVLAQWKKEIEKVSDEYIQSIIREDKTLKDSAGKTLSGFHKEIDRLGQKFKRSIRQKEEVQLQRIRKVRQHLFPGGKLQEREISFLYFMNKYGTGIWDDMIGKLDSPFFERHKLIYL